jgi:competence protein ComEA
MNTLSRNKMLAASALITLLLGVIFFNLYQRGRTEEAAFTVTGTPRESHRKNLTSIAAGRPLPHQGSEPKSDVSEVVVHVAGAVRNPGVFHLKPDMRADDAIKAAGGATSIANLDAINLAAKVEDGSQLFIPERGVSGDEQGGAAASSVYAASGSKAGSSSSHGGTSGHSSKLSQPGKEFVSINGASETELQKLPGVGPAMAARIIQHRKESGKFTDPEQLMDVSGIGEKKFAKMRPFVKVN